MQDSETVHVVCDGGLWLTDNLLSQTPPFSSGAVEEFIYRLENNQSHAPVSLLQRSRQTSYFEA